ncbi:MAG: hypothetical protein C0503_00065 [Gemmatimonas sp.]|nr:hypothetical protein [Gemmatimonas sp.]
MLCVRCVTPIADDAKFCHSCGSMVSDAEGQAAASAAMNDDSFAIMERMLREETAGEYTIGRMLGRGGMAVVYLAEEPKLGRKVALKVLPPELTFGHGVERFLREAKTAATLDHPNIIPIYRIGASGRLFWYAMKFLEGRSLEDDLKDQGKLGLETTIQILDQICDALDYAHERGVVHRDVKPANVMLDARNRVTLTDFGIAKALSDGGLTATGSLVGTPYYMSPEQGRGKGITGAADQYSVGVMAYVMLTGKVPFDGESAIDVLHQHCTIAAPRLADTAPHLPPHVSEVIEKVLAKDPADRFPNCRALVQALRDPTTKYARASGRTLLIDSNELRMRLASGLRPELSLPGEVTLPASGSRPATPKRGMWVAAIAATLVIATLGVFALNGSAGGADASTAAPSVTALPPAAGDEAPAAPAPSSPSTAAPSSGSETRSTREATAAPAAAAPVRRSAESALAELLLVLPTPGVVTIDGVDRGEQSRMRDSLRAGVHNIRIAREGFTPIDTSISFASGESKRVTLQLVARP